MKTSIDQKLLLDIVDALSTAIKHAGMQPEMGCNFCSYPFVKDYTFRHENDCPIVVLYEAQKHPLPKKRDLRRSKERIHDLRREINDIAQGMNQ